MWIQPANTDVSLFIFLFLCSGTAEVKPEGVVNDVPKTNLTDGKDELFYGSQKYDPTEDCMQTDNMQDDIASQTSMDCGSAGELDESDLGGSRSNAAQVHCSNGQKSKRPSSPGPHPVKTTYFETHSPNPKVTLCFSPDSSACKSILFNNSADKEHEGIFCAEKSGFAMAKVLDSQQFVNNSDSGSLAKERSYVVAIGTQNAEIVECSGSSDVSQDLIGSQSGVIFERYL